MADNLNTPYLGQLTSSDNLNTPFLPETASEATQNFRSDISTTGELHAQGDAVVGGTLDTTGEATFTTVVATGTIDTDSAVSIGELTATGANFSSVISSTDALGGFGSVATAANDTGMGDGEFRFVNAASGVSIAYRSGGTTYYIPGSTESEA